VLSEQQVKLWMYNNGRRREGKKISSTKKYTYRHVVAQTMKDELEELIKELSGALPGTQEYFSKYQAGLKMICDGLSTDVVDEFRLVAKEWNAGHPPAKVQQA
jgi:hypothetical protein